MIESCDITAFFYCKASGDQSSAARTGLKDDTERRHAGDNTIAARIRELTRRIVGKELAHKSQLGVSFFGLIKQIPVRNGRDHLKARAQNGKRRYPSVNGCSVDPFIHSKSKARYGNKIHTIRHFSLFGKKRRLR